jgi:NhaP-type Na+/H+ or K+/H+ antiporter
MVRRVRSSSMNPKSRRIAARVVGGTVVGLAAGWAAGRILRGVPRARFAALVLVVLAHQEFDSPVSDWVYKRLP